MRNTPAGAGKAFVVGREFAALKKHPRRSGEGSSFNTNALTMGNTPAGAGKAGVI